MGGQTEFGDRLIGSFSSDAWKRILPAGRDCAQVSHWCLFFSSLANKQGSGPLACAIPGKSLVVV